MTSMSLTWRWEPLGEKRRGIMVEKLEQDENKWSFIDHYEARNCLVCYSSLYAHQIHVSSPPIPYILYESVCKFLWCSASSVSFNNWRKILTYSELHGYIMTDSTWIGIVVSSSSSRTRPNFRVPPYPLWHATILCSKQNTFWRTPDSSVHMHIPKWNSFTAIKGTVKQTGKSRYLYLSVVLSFFILKSLQDEMRTVQHVILRLSRSTPLTCFVSHLLDTSQTQVPSVR